MPSPTSSGTTSAAPTISATWAARIVATAATRITRGSTALKQLETASEAVRVSISRRRVIGAGKAPTGASRAARSQPVDELTEPRRRALDVHEGEAVELPDESHHVAPRLGLRQRERVGELARDRPERTPGAREHERSARVQRPGMATHRVAQQLLPDVDAGSERDDVRRGNHQPPAPSRRSSAASAAARNTTQIATTTTGSGTPSDTSRGATSPTASDAAIAIAANAAMVVI